MPGVPLDAFAQVKKGLRRMLTKRTKSRREEPSATTNTEKPLASSTSPAAPQPAAAPSASIQPVEKGNDEPTTRSTIENGSRQELDSSTIRSCHVPTAPTTTTHSPAPQSTITQAPAHPPLTTAPDVVITPPDEPHVDAVSSIDSTAAEPTTTATAASRNTSTPTLADERPSSPAPQMSATSGPLDDHPTFA